VRQHGDDGGIGDPTQVAKYEDENQQEMADEMGITLEEVKAKVEALHEFNPMLGHRGCRLSISYPELSFDPAAQTILYPSYVPFEELARESIEGIESGISWLKRSLGLTRCTWKGWDSFKSYVWSSIVTANVMVIARKQLAS